LVQGRYIKLHRRVSQTPWFLADGPNTLKAITSVQDEISKCLSPLFEPAEGTVYLHAAGREDIDVRMLGSGRPYVFELVNPKKSVSAREALKVLEIKGEFVRNVGALALIDKRTFDAMKEKEVQKAKRYSAVCWADRELAQADIDKLESLRSLQLA